MRGLLWWVLLALEAQFPLLILKSIESEQMFKEASPYMHISRWAKGSGYPYWTALCTRGNFSSENLTKTLSHSKNTRARASKSLPETLETTMLSKSLAILSGPSLKVNSFRGALPFSPGLPPASLGWAALLQWMTPGAQLHHSRYRDLNNYRHPIWYFGWGGMCFFSFRAKKSSISYLTSKDFV